MQRVPIYCLFWSKPQPSATISKDYRDYRNPESDALFKITELWLKAQFPGSPQHCILVPVLEWKTPHFQAPTSTACFPASPPEQNEATSASAINRVVRVETSPSSPENHPDPVPGGQLKAPAAAGSALAPTTPPAAGASEPSASQPGGSSARARGQRARPRERAGRVTGTRAHARGRRARARSESASASARAAGRGCVGWSSERSGGAPEPRGRAGLAQRERTVSERTRGAPAGLLGLAAACLAGADRFPGPEWPPPRETRLDTGLRRGAAGVRTARTRAARCAAGLGWDQRRGRCSPRGPRAKCPRRRSARPSPAGRAPPSAAGARSLPRLLRGAPGGSGPDPGLARERTRHKLCLLLFLAL